MLGKHLVFKGMKEAWCGRSLMKVGGLARGEAEEEGRQGLLEYSKQFVFYAQVQREIIKDF